MIKTAFVMGGSGFLGRYLLEELSNYSIQTSVLVNRNRPTKVDLQRTWKGSLENFDWMLLEEDLPDVIFHTARMSGRNRAERLKAARQNADANKRLLSWLSSLENPPLLVFVSGTLVYGSHGKNQVDESFLPDPISFQREYFLAEQPVLKVLEKDELPVTVVRPAWILGQGSWFEAFYLNPIRKHQKVPLYGKGENLMSFIHAKDVAGKMVYAASHDPAGRIFNLFQPEAIPQKHFVEMIASYNNVPVRKIPLWWLRLRYDRAVAEAFGFSLNVQTQHQGFWKDYQAYYPETESSISEALNSFS